MCFYLCQCINYFQAVFFGTKVFLCTVFCTYLQFMFVYFFKQKLYWQKGAFIMLVNGPQVSISPTFNEQWFCTKSVFAAFLCLLQFAFVIFFRKKIVKKKLKKAARYVCEIDYKWFSRYVFTLSHIEDDHFSHPKVRNTTDVFLQCFQRSDRLTRPSSNWVRISPSQKRKWLVPSRTKSSNSLTGCNILQSTTCNLRCEWWRITDRAAMTGDPISHWNWLQLDGRPCLCKVEKPRTRNIPKCKNYNQIENSRRECLANQLDNS